MLSCLYPNKFITENLFKYAIKIANNYRIKTKKEKIQKHIAFKYLERPFTISNL